MQKVADRLHKHIRDVCPEGEKASLELIIGVRFLFGEDQQSPQLLHIGSDGSVAWENEVVCGTGDVIARSYLSILHTKLMPMAMMRPLAMFVVHQAKRFGFGVGGATHIYTLPRSGVYRLVDESELARLTERAMHLCIVDARDPSFSQEIVEKMAELLKNEIVKLKVISETEDQTRRSYGYGRWDAPYWFIGPEQGQGRDERNDLGPRLTAWRELGTIELCDCERFHWEINERAWHQEENLQPTWRSLILLLMAFQGKSTDLEALRKYQRSEWGNASGETCVIELSGLAANNLGIPRDREKFLQERIDTIRERIKENHPKLVVMYGSSQKDSWEKIAGRAFPDDNVIVSDGTIFAVTPHPVSYGQSNAFWEELGKRLRDREARTNEP